MHAFFSRYQPARLQTDAHFVNNILAHWAGREAELMETLNRRSQPEPADTSDSRPYTDPSDATSDADVRSSETSGESDVEAPPEHDGDSVSRAHTVDHAEIRSGDNHNSCTHPHRSTGINLHTDTQSNPHTHPPSSDSGHHVTTETSTADVADRYEDVGDVRRAEDAVSMPHRTQVQSKPDTKDMELRRAEAVVLAREAQRKTQLETKREPLVAWLNDCCGLGARVEEFIALGVDEVSDFNLIEISDLEDMGLTTPLINMFMSNVDVEDWDKDFMNSSYV